MKNAFLYEKKKIVCQNRILFFHTYIDLTLVLTLSFGWFREIKLKLEIWLS